MASIEIRRLRGSARETHARGVIARFAARGASKAAFCREEGMSTVTLSRWLRQFGERERPAAQNGFVEVRLDRGAAQRGFELELASGWRLRIPPDFSAPDLDRLLAVLGRASC